MKIEIVHAAPADTMLLSEIERECFSHPLTEPQLLSLLQDPQTLFRAAREMPADTPDSPDADRRPQPVPAPRLLGSVWAQTVLDEGYIGNVAVRPAFRRQGIAGAMLMELEKLARERSLSFLTLEVRAGNVPAIALYEKHGYSRVGLRRGYYSDPREDAILMTKTLPGQDG